MDSYFMKMPEDLFCEICSEKRGINPDTLREVIILAVDIVERAGRGEESALCSWSRTPKMS